jgi:acetyl-CoA acetyltransferase
MSLESGTLVGISSEWVNSFVLGEAARRNSGSLNTVATGLRALLRFLHARHYISAPLVDAVPVAPGWRDRGVARAVAADEVARMLAGCDRRTGTGRRDFAILTVLARLGLRRGEVAALSVDDINWHTGELVVTGKGNHRELLPLPVDVGEAIADYCRDGRRNGGCSELRLAAEAVLDALDDAGLTPADVDGMVTFTMDSNTEVAVARATGIGELKFFSKIHHGGGAACATIQQAAIAVATGVAECVVAYRAFNKRSGTRFGQVQLRLVENADSTGVDNSFSYPHGLSTPAAQVEMIAKRYMQLSGATSKDFGAVSVADRKHAANNPKAYFYQKPITIEDHQNSRWIAEPLRLLDCCQETDGGVALVVTSAQRARDLKHRPVIIAAASQGSSPDQYSMVSYYRPELGPARDGSGRQAAVVAVGPEADRHSDRDPV